MTRAQSQPNLWVLVVSSTKESVRLYFDPLRLLGSYSRKLLDLMVNHLEQGRISPNVLALAWLMINVSTSIFFFVQFGNWLFIYSGLVMGLGITWWSWLQQRERSLTKRLSVGFGSGKDMGALEMPPIAIAYLRQQRWAFGFVWFSFAFGITLAGFLLARLFFKSKFGYTEMADTFLLGSTIFMLGSALRLYRLSTARRREILDALSKGETRLTTSLLHLKKL